MKHLFENKTEDQGLANVFGFIFVLCIVLFTVATFFLLGIAPLRYISQRNALNNKTSLIVNEIEQNVLAKTTNHLKHLAQADVVKNYLAYYNNLDEVKVALDLIKNISSASLVYVMDKKGNVVASTEFLDDEGNISSLKGNNYSFRPYFSGAIKGKGVTYSAVGVTTGKRGIYSSWPIKAENDSNYIGVVVVKMGLKTVDSILTRRDEQALLLNPENVVFASNVPDWLYRINKNNVDTNLVSNDFSKQFNLSIMDTLPFKINNPEVKINDTTYLLNRKTLSNKGWKVVLLEKESNNYPLDKQFVKVILIALGSIIIFGLIIFFLLYIIRKKKKAEIELRLHRENLRITLNSIGDGVIAVDNRGLVMQLNTVASKLIEYEEVEAIGKKIRDVFRVVMPGTYKPLIDIFEEGNKKDLILLSKTNKEIEISKLATPIKNNLGNTVGVVVVFRDITDQKETKLKLKKQFEQTKKALQKAEESDNLKTAFLQNISHEIRTPLNGIIGFSELLLVANDNIEKDNYRKHIVENGKYLLSLIQDVIEVSKIETGQVELFVKPFDLNKGLANIYEKFNMLNSNNNINFSINISNNSNVIFETDGEKLMKIISNLLDNAFKFTDKGSIELGYTQQKNGLNFYVKDSGIGISKDQHNEIFKRFSQVSSNSYETHKGVGIGLTIAQKYVQLLNGTIWLESKLNEGTTFYFTIPNKPNKNKLNE